MPERIVVLDFGAQYNQLIARRVREAGVFSELLPYNAPLSRIRGDALSGVILSGGPDSAYWEGAKRCDPGVFELGVPVLGVCYGMQLMAQQLGCRVGEAPVREFGRTAIRFAQSPLFAGVDSETVWMTHNDAVLALPQGFHTIAATEHCPIAAFADGVVEYTGEDNSYGRYFKIDHGNGVKSFYAHCSQVLVQKGQTVALGETVGLVGSTGNVTGPHLHLELKYGKLHLNPAYYVEFLPAE